jgi:hypothetical protein
MKGAIMNMDKIYNSNYETELKNGYLRIKGISHLGCLALTTIIYDGDIRIPCEVIEKDGMVRCVSFKLIYMPWFASRSIAKGLKFIMFPQRICKSKAVIEAFISE